MVPVPVPEHGLDACCKFATGRLAHRMRDRCDRPVAVDDVVHDEVNLSVDCPLADWWVQDPLIGAAHADEGAIKGSGSRGVANVLRLQVQGQRRRRK